jgi:membrane protease YdiL (CAAX protease family)
MMLLQTVALGSAMFALILSVLNARRYNRSRFPLAVLIEQWFGARTGIPFLLMAAAAGIVSVALVPLICAAVGTSRIRMTGPLTFSWSLLALAAIGVKLLFVLFEEIIYRGALLAQLRARTPAIVAVSISSVLFALSHPGRSTLDLAIVAADGIGFGASYLMTRSLWLPVMWHFGKNVSVWLLYGRGTIDVTHGLFALEESGTAASTGHLLVTVAVVALVADILRRNAHRGP